MKTFNALSEEVTQQQLNDVEKFADRILAKFNVDIEFTRHFADRMNDARNKPAVSVAELQQIFKKIAKKKAKDIRQNPDSEAVIKDIQKDLNLPVVISYNKSKEEFEVTTKTIMRKKDFKTSSKVITTEKTLTPAEIKKREEIAKAIEKDSPGMPMAKKMAIATATAKRVAEGAEKYTVKKGDYTRKVDGATADRMKRQGWRVIATEAKKMKDDPCWKDHEMVGTKVKNGKTVPNCVPKENKGSDMHSESTAEYGKSQAAIARKKQQAAMKPGEMDKLKRLKDMLKNANKKESVEEALSPSYQNKYIGMPDADLRRKRNSFLDQINDLVKFKKKSRRDPEVVDLEDKVRKINYAMSHKKESVELDEAMGKLNAKGEIEMTAKNYAKVHKDYKTKMQGVPYAMQIDPKTGGSALFPVKIIKESVELDEATATTKQKKSLASLMTKALGGKKSKPGYTSSIASNGDFVAYDDSMRIQGRIKKGDFTDPMTEARQMKDPKKDSMVTKGGRTIVIDKSKEAEYLKKGWILSEALSVKPKSLFNLLEELKEGKKPVSQMTPAEKEADAKRRKEYKAYQKSKRNEELEEATADLYFDTYTAAVQHAAAQAKKKGFEVVEDDWFQQVTVGKGRPKDGDTTRHTLKLTKDGKPVRKGLSIQVYNRGGSSKKPYELNFYVS